MNYIAIIASIPFEVGLPSLHIYIHICYRYEPGFALQHTISLVFRSELYILPKISEVRFFSHLDGCGFACHRLKQHAGNLL